MPCRAPHLDENFLFILPRWAKNRPRTYAARRLQHDPASREREIGSESEGGRYCTEPYTTIFIICWITKRVYNWWIFNRLEKLVTRHSHGDNRAYTHKSSENLRHQLYKWNKSYLSVNVFKQNKTSSNFNFLWMLLVTHFFLYHIRVRNLTQNQKNEIWVSRINKWTVRLLEWHLVYSRADTCLRITS